MIRDLIRNLNSNSYCLIIDIDAFPLSKYAIKPTFVLAMLKGKMVISNEQTVLITMVIYSLVLLIFVSIMKLYKQLNESAWIANERSDVSEEITWTKPDLIDQNLFKNIKNFI